MDHIGQALAWPLRGGSDQRLLHGVLAGLEVAIPANDGAQHAGRELAQQALRLRIERAQDCSVGGALITCRTSMFRYSGAPPGPGASEASAAMP